MRGGVDFARDVARLVHDRNRAIAGVFDDLAFDDVDDRRPIAVAVPGDDTARLDDELAQAQLTLRDFGRLVRELDRGEHRIGDALGGCHVHLRQIAAALVGWAFAGTRRVQDCEHRARDDAGREQAVPDGPATNASVDHIIISVFRFGRDRRISASTACSVGEKADEWKYRIASESIAAGYFRVAGRGSFAVTAGGHPGPSGIDTTSFAGEKLGDRAVKSARIAPI